MIAAQQKLERQFGVDNSLVTTISFPWVISSLHVDGVAQECRSYLVADLKDLISRFASQIHAHLMAYRHTIGGYPDTLSYQATALFEGREVGYCLRMQQCLTHTGENISDGCYELGWLFDGHHKIVLEVGYDGELFDLVACASEEMQDYLAEWLKQPTEPMWKFDMSIRIATKEISVLITAAVFIGC